MTFDEPADPEPPAPSSTRAILVCFALMVAAAAVALMVSESLW